MDVWISWTRKESTCKYCSKPIKLKSMSLTAKLWRKGFGALPWSKTMHFHIACWVQQGIDYLNLHPYVPRGNRGRKRLEVDSPTRAARLKLQRKRADLIFRIQKHIDNGDGWRVEKLALQVEGLREEMEKLGGVPESWNKTREKVVKYVGGVYEG